MGKDPKQCGEEGEDWSSRKMRRGDEADWEEVAEEDSPECGLAMRLNPRLAIAIAITTLRCLGRSWPGPRAISAHDP